MAYNVLNDELRQQLEQERSRLVSDRQAIIESVTVEIDRLIQHIDALLGGKLSPTQSNGASSPEAPSNSRGKGSSTASALLDDAADVAVSPQTEGPSKAKGKRRKAKSFDPKDLKRDFKGMTASDAMVQVMAQSPDKPFLTDEMIQELYGEVDESDLSRARKSVAAVLTRGARFGRFEKVQDNPAQYKLSESA